MGIPRPDIVCPNFHKFGRSRARVAGFANSLATKASTSGRGPRSLLRSGSDGRIMLCFSFRRSFIAFPPTLFPCFNRRNFAIDTGELAHRSGDFPCRTSVRAIAAAIPRCTVYKLFHFFQWAFSQAKEQFQYHQLLATGSFCIHPACEPIVFWTASWEAMTLTARLRPPCSSGVLLAH